MYPYYELRQVPFDCQKRRTRLSCASHLHDQVEMVYITEGKVQVTVDTKPYTLEPGDVCIAFPNQVHSYVDVQANQADIYIFAPQFTILADTFLHFRPRSPVVRQGVKAEERVLLSMIFEKNESEEPFAEEMVKGCLSAFLARLLSSMVLEETKPNDMSALKNILAYCNRYYKEPLTLEILSQELHVSKYYISHLFSDKLHISFRGYINSLRIFDACRRMDRGQDNVTEIAAQVGFDTLRTFNRVFYRYRNTTPSAYIKGICSKDEGEKQ